MNGYVGVQIEDATAKIYCALSHFSHKDFSQSAVSQRNFPVVILKDTAGEVCLGDIC